jgi:hypothetical protein
MPVDNDPDANAARKDAGIAVAVTSQERLSDSDVSYRLDGQDRIVEVGGHWDRLAHENEGAAVVADRVLGTTLYAHVADEASRMFVWTMLDSVRKLRRPSTKPYRCDSPECRRHMQMTIVPEAAGGLLVQHQLIKIEKRPVRMRFVGLASEGLARVVRCSMCVRLKIAGVWHEPKPELLTGLTHNDGATRVVYSVCEDCRDRARRPPTFIE